MTALEAFNALDNREVSRKEVEQVLTQAKAENNTAIIYRLSRVLNDSPEATHFEITITHYDSPVGLSGVQHTGDYREALDDCGRLRKGWKFVKGNVIKVEKKEKPKKGKTPKNILKLRTALSAPHQEDEIAFLAGAGIDYFEEAPDDQPRGLGKPIPAADIYKMITDKIIKMLKSTKASDYKKTWKDDAFFIPLNYDSKKPYRGVNRLLLQERIGFAGAFRNPYFLTFKQIKKHKGTLKKGAKGYEVIYYSIRYVVPADKNSGRKAYSSTNAQKVLDFLHKYNLPESEVTRIPMIRYYNVYNGADIENMDFKLDELQIGRAVPDSATENRAAQLIVENYPNPPAIKNEGNQAYYNPASDYIKLPKQEQFDTVNDYYRTLFHELTHSTGHNKRLNRGIHLMLEKDDYAKEELVAEFGAVFLSAWAGIMWYNNKNHAAYLKGWNSAIKEAQNDNKFLMRAASLAQQATDYILNLNAKGEPAFLAELAKINPEKEEKKTKKATKKPQKNTENPEHHKYFQEKKKEAEIQLKEAIERVKKSNYRNTAVEYAQVVALKCEMIKHIEENAKLYNATPAELEYIRLYLSYLTIDQVKYHFIKNDHYMSTDMVGLKPHFSRLFSKTRPKAFAKVKDRKYSYKFNENGKKFINDYVELYENFYKNPPTFEDNKIAEAEGVSTENVEDSSKKKVEKAPAKATKSLKSRGGNVQKEANFTLLQEPTKVFLEFEDEKNEIYYKKSADKQGAVGSDFLKKVLKDLKKQNLKEEPRGFINTEDFPVKPTISKITGIDSLKTIVVKDNIRPVLECVLIEADRYVATDLYNIILLNRPKNDGLKTGALYDPNYKCIKIGGCSKQEYYRDIEGGYLNYKAVLTENPVYTSDWVAIEPIVQHLKSGLEVIRKIYDRKRVYMVKITSNVGEGHYNLKYLLNDLQILQSNGAKKIRLYTNKLDNRALNIETDNGNMALTMPVYMGDRSNYVDVISPLRIAPIQLHFTQNRKEEKGLSGADYSQGLFGTVPEVSTERFKKMSVPELREYTLEYYLENYGGKSISKNFFKEDNIQIEFFNTAGKKLQKPIYKEKVAVLEHLESLIKNSTYNNWGNRKESSPPNIIGYLNFKAKVTIDGEKRHVRISIAVDRDRKFRFKTFEVGANPKKKKQATSIPAPWVTESLRDSSLSEGKGTKKSLSRKKKEENFGLNASEAPVTSLPAPRQTLAQQLATRPEVRESFLVADEQMSLFLGTLEKKTKDSLVITLTGKQGSGKTRFAFQFMNALAQRYRVGHASIEEHPESVLYEEKAYQYLNDTALEHITAQDVRSLEELDTMIRTNEVIVIDSFQKMRELAPHFEIDKDLRKKYDGKLFLVIFQQTADGKMRGGSKSQFDGDIILFTETFPDYRENYVYPDKNRYNKRPATELQYSIYEQRMLATAPEVPALPAHYEPTESEELNFEVL
ncbi:zincin-like metallopeptidase domain-containing protein [Capnocytophaga gingivalis]|uniref:zincin-like metallopeptidase domain-containing protein n=1 Tax=Capnocytophaga gingivalis TaxID=1017 RepID=UPI0028D24A40|nr:zincin-like metallopeptidase domain-containing protein [Capnocytophaga gingivalis]